MAGISEAVTFRRGLEFIRPEFCGMDSNDRWVGECGATGCHGRHNILKNNVMCLPNDCIMNWWDFLDVLQCYERNAQCGVCTSCSQCQEFFLCLLEEAWGADPKQLEGRRTTFCRSQVQPPFGEVPPATDDGRTTPSPGPLRRGKKTFFRKRKKHFS